MLGIATTFCSKKVRETAASVRRLTFTPRCGTPHVKTRHDYLFDSHIVSATGPRGPSQAINTTALGPLNVTAGSSVTPVYKEVADDRGTGRRPRAGVHGLPAACGVRPPYPCRRGHPG
jgi:hypothetical protein